MKYKNRLRNIQLDLELGKAVELLYLGVNCRTKGITFTEYLRFYSPYGLVEYTERELLALYMSYPDLILLNLKLTEDINAFEPTDGISFGAYSKVKDSVVVSGKERYIILKVYVDAHITSSIYAVKCIDFKGKLHLFDVETYYNMMGYDILKKNSNAFVNLKTYQQGDKTKVEVLGVYVATVPISMFEKPYTESLKAPVNATQSFYIPNATPYNVATNVVSDEVKHLFKSLEETDKHYIRVSFYDRGAVNLYKQVAKVNKATAYMDMKNIDLRQISIYVDYLNKRNIEYLFVDHIETVTELEDIMSYNQLVKLYKGKLIAVCSEEKQNIVLKEAEKLKIDTIFGKTFYF